MSAHQNGTARILAVEDDPIMQKMLRDMLQPEGFEFRVCAKGVEALGVAASEKPDLILLDVNLPDLNGMEVCRVLKDDERTRNIPILMLTGSAKERTNKERSAVRARP